MTNNTNNIDNNFLIPFRLLDEKSSIEQHEISSKQINLTNKVSQQIFTPEQIAEGAVKIVWIKHLSIGNSDKIDKEKQSVYYTAKSSFLGLKEKELKGEFNKMQVIKTQLFIKGKSFLNLAVEGKELTGEKRIQSRYTLKVQRSMINFEKLVCSLDLALNNRIQLGGDFLNGLSSLHLVNFAHGDMKLENCLIYEHEGRLLLKIADFGKTEQVQENETKIYKGNTRFAPPEGKMSQKGDVFSGALILIRNFEEEYLGPTSMLLPVDPASFDMPADESFRGIEKFIVEHRAFPAANEGFDLLKRLKIAASSENEQAIQSQLIHQYIDALKAKMQKDGRFSPQQAEDLSKLLKRMTESDPKLRISSHEAATIYRQIFEI